MGRSSTWRQGFNAVALLLLAGSVSANMPKQPALASAHSELSQLKGLAMGTKTSSGALPQLTKLETISEGRSYGDRVSDAFWGFVAGTILFFSSFLFLYFVEYETCKAFVLINRAKTACNSEITADKVQKKYQNCMVHVSGHATVQNGQKDDELGVTPSEKSLVLKRTVEVYQWVEETEKEDDRTNYIYNQKWREEDVNSNDFEHSLGHENPPRQHPVFSKKIMNDPVHLGAFNLKTNVLDKMEHFEPLENLSSTHRDFTVAEKGGVAGTREINYLSPAAFVAYFEHSDTSGATDSISGNGQHLISGKTDANGLYTTPVVGDLRISYQVIKEGAVSIAAVQTEDTFRRFLMQRDGTVAGRDQCHMYEFVADEEPPSEATCCFCADYILSKVGQAFPHTILLVNQGKLDKGTMFSKVKDKLSKTSNIMRLIGFLIMWIGLYLMLSPIADILSFVPFVSHILKTLFGVVTFLVTIVLSSMTIALAWVIFHPELLACILGVVGGVLWAHGTSVLPKYLPGYTHACIDVEKCGLAVEIGQILMIAAVFPLIYLIYLQVQEVRFWWAIRTEMAAREKNDVDLV